MFPVSKGEMKMYYDEAQPMDLKEDEVHDTEMKEGKTKGKLIGLIIFLAIFALYSPLQFLGMHRMLSEYKLPAGAEVVFKPKTILLDCCSACRLGIEEVYRIPVERANQIEYGETYGPQGRFVVEPLGAGEGIDQAGVHFGRTYESDCGYRYHYSDLMDWEGYRENDGYFYVHVWGRRVLGPADGFASFLICLSGLSGFVLILLLPILVLVFLVRIAKRAIKKRQ